MDRDEIFTLLDQARFAADRAEKLVREEAWRAARVNAKLALDDLLQVLVACAHREAAENERTRIRIVGEPEGSKTIEAKR
jgi:hypothetical protein